MAELGKKREEILRYIRNSTMHFRRPPTIREIAEACKIKSTSAVLYHLKWLEKLGYIKRESGSRNIRLNHEHLIHNINVETVKLPLVGVVKAGTPNIAIEETGTSMNVPKTVAKNNKDYFLLRVDGTSMIDAGIVPGDIVVIKKGADVREGDIVVAVIGDEATLKRLVKAKNGWILKPENKELEPIILREDQLNSEEFKINGKMVGKVVPDVITGL